MNPDQEHSENPRLHRIKKVSRFFRWLCFLLLIGGSAFAVAIWFLPMTGDKIKAEWKRNSVSEVSTEPTAEMELAVGRSAPVEEQGSVKEPSNAGAVSSNETRTVGGRLSFGAHEPAGEEKIRPEFVWIVRPLLFLIMIFHVAGVWILYQLFRFYEGGFIFHRRPVQCIRWMGIWLLAKWALTNILELTDVITHNPSFSDLRIDGYFLGGLLVLLVSWIMEEAAKLQEEQELTI